MKMIKTHEFRTAVYEGHISFNQKKVLKISVVYFLTT